MGPRAFGGAGRFISPSPVFSKPEKKTEKEEVSVIVQRVIE
jgi:hypothetical protein